jgi:YVTN family beta-propeller protein
MLTRLPILVVIAVLIMIVLGVESAPIPKASAASQSGLLVVENQFDHALLLVDPVAKREIARVVVGVNGHEVTLSKDGRLAYVPIYSNVAIGEPGTDGNTIDIIDLQARKLVGSMDLGKPVRPHRAQLGPDGLLYVTAELDNAVAVIDPATQKVLAKIPTDQPQTHMLVLTPDGRRAYTANVSAGSVSVLDLKTRKLITVIPVAKTIQRISISPDGSRVFTHDRESARVAVIDTASNKISDWIAMPEMAYASTPTPDGRWLLVATNGSDRHRLYVVDLQTLKIDHSFDLPGIPLELLVRPGVDVAYVSCIQAGKIAVLDLRSWQMEEPISLSRGVDGLAWTTAVQ